MPVEIQKEEPVERELGKLAVVPATTRLSALEKAEGMIRQSVRGEVLGKLGDSEIVVKGYAAIGLTNLTKRQWKGVANGEFFLVMEYTDERSVIKSLVSRDVVGLAEESGINEKNLRSAFQNGYSEGTLPELERLKAKAESEGKHVRKFYFARVVDCLQFVNLALAPEARAVHPDSITDVLNAVNSGQAHAVSLPQKNFETVSAAFANAKIGDILIFLQKEDFRNLLEARAFELASGGTLIWLDANNKVVDVSRMKNSEKPDAIPFSATHSAIYAGTDAAAGPLVLQAHIYAGSMAREALAPYVAKYREIDGVAVISSDFFAKEKKLFADNRK